MKVESELKVKELFENLLMFGIEYGFPPVIEDCPGEEKEFPNYILDSYEQDNFCLDKSVILTRKLEKNIVNRV